MYTEDRLDEQTGIWLRRITETYDPVTHIYYKSWKKTYENWEKYEGWWYYVRWQLVCLTENDAECVETWTCQPVENGPLPIQIAGSGPPTLF